MGTIAATSRLQCKKARHVGGRIWRGRNLQKLLLVPLVSGFQVRFKAQARPTFKNTDVHENARCDPPMRSIFGVASRW